MMNPQFAQTQMMNGKYKTQLCRHFMSQGVCLVGAKCQFAHGKDELRQPLEDFQAKLFQQPFQASIYQTNFLKQQQQQQFQVKPVNYKTMLCKYYNPLTGQCKNGIRCTFAHGEADLVKQQSMVAQQYAFGQLGGGGAMSLKMPSIVPMIQQQTPQNYGSTMQQYTVQPANAVFNLLREMETIFSKDTNIITQLRLGQQYALQGLTQEASVIIKEIINDPARTDLEKSQYETIYHNALQIQSQQFK